MRTGALLEQLIAAAQAVKTELALSMNMTPSGLSKILTGKRLPFQRERDAFSRQAAKFLANALYGPNCYLKLAELFPLAYDFESKGELESFLMRALNYALDIDYAAENGEDAQYPGKEVSYLGRAEVLDMLCIIVSNLTARGEAPPLELHNAKTFFNHQYADIFERVKFTGGERINSVTVNHYFEAAAVESANERFDLNMLNKIVMVESYVNVTLHCVPGQIEHPFILARGQFLMLFSTQIDGSPLMTLVRHRGYLAVFYNALSHLSARKVSYTAKEAAELLSDQPGLLENLAARGISAVYNALSIGYMLEKGDFSRAAAQSPAVEPILALFRHILKWDTLFYVTMDAMLNITATGRAIMPLVGAVELPSEERLSYLHRLLPYADARSHEKIRIISGAMPKMTILCAKDLAILYIADASCTYEKIHCLETNAVKAILDAALMERAGPPLNFSMELWNEYIGRASRELLG